jgi:7-cyano-7-deazaguanine synthase in queuosine biosynthesis
MLLKTLILQMSENIQNILFQLPENKSTRFLRSSAYLKLFDAYSIGCIIFNLETAFRLNYKNKEIEIPISHISFHKWPLERLSLEISNLFTYVTYHPIKIKFIEKIYSFPEKYLPIKKLKTVCLFSGGVDSTTGLALSYQYFHEPISSIFACHSDQGKIGGVVDDILKFLPFELKAYYHKISVPRMHSAGYSQLRGFLYVICASIFAYLHEAKRILITECGPTMYQMKFSPYDSITMTTHPYVLSKAKRIIEIMLGREFQYIIPFENMTKAEVALENPFPATLKKCHSCIGSRWINSGDSGRAPNDGLCYGCVIRRLGLISARLGDSEYEYDPLLEGGPKCDNLNSLLAFSLETSIDFSGIDDYCRVPIVEFGKSGLFRRFALENIAALHILVKSGKNLSENISHFYVEAINNIGKTIIERRLSELHMKTIKPNFSRQVP